MKYIFEQGKGHEDLLSHEEMINFAQSNESVLTEDLMRNHKSLKRETFIVNKNGYMFHIVVRDTPIIGNPDSDKRTPNHRQLYFNLRDKEIYITLNNKELTINQDSLDNFITKSSLDLFETDENRGMYTFMIRALSALPGTGEHSNKPGRALIRLMESYSKLELIYKVTPMLCKFALMHRGYYSDSIHVALIDLLNLSKTDSTKPKDIFKTKQININKAEKQLELFFENNGNGSPENTLWQCIIKRPSYIEIYIEISETLDLISDNDETKEPLSSWRGSYTILDRFIEAKNLGIDFKTLLNYIFYQCDHTQAMTASSAITVLTDYYRLVSHLPKYRRYPKYLKTAHDVASKNYKLTESDAMKIGIERTYKNNSKMEMILGDYVFTLPKQASDLAAEGAMMSNCVAGYAKNVSNGSTTIVFMRNKKKPNDSLVTVEVRGGNIVQAYAAYNRSIGDKELIGMVKWAKVNNIGVSVYYGRLEAAENAAKKLRWKSEEVVPEAEAA